MMTDPELSELVLELRDALGTPRDNGLARLAMAELSGRAARWGYWRRLRGGALPDFADGFTFWGHNPAEPEPRTVPPCNVILLDDQDHSYYYVIHMLQLLFGHSQNLAYQMAEEVDNAGRVIVATLALEHAEFKRDQIHALGRDRRLIWSRGAMSAVVEPAFG